MLRARLRLTNVLLTLVLLAVLAVISMLATDARGGSLDPTTPPASTDSVKLPGTPISTGPYTISAPGHYYLTRDIAVSGATNALTINANDVSLDLGGFTVSGTDTMGTYGVVISGIRRGVHISNGTIKDFHLAIGAADDKYVTIDRVHAMSNIRGYELGAESVLTNCTARDNAESGIVVFDSGNRVSECTMVDNASDAITVFGVTNLIERNFAIGNAAAHIIDTGDSPSKRNVFRENVVGNIVLKINGESYVDGNVCIGSLSNPTGNTIGSNLGC